MAKSYMWVVTLPNGKEFHVPAQTKEAAKRTAMARLKVRKIKSIK